MERRYMISEAANLANVDAHVLRYWEEELGLAVPRNELGHRYYTEENLEQFRRIKEWKEQGYQLKAIRILVHEREEDKLISERPLSDKKETQLIPDASARNTVKLEQFQAIMKDIIREAMEENNQSIGREVSYQVGDKVLKEMNYLMRVQDEAEEERFRKLDEAIRNRRPGKKPREEKGEKAAKFLRKNKKLNPNLSI